MDGLRQDVASANRERAVWKKRDGELMAGLHHAAITFSSLSIPGLLCKRASTARYVCLDDSKPTFDSTGVMPRTRPHEACTAVAL